MGAYIVRQDSLKMIYSMYKYLSLPAEETQALPLIQKILLAFAASIVLIISAKISIPMYPVPTTMQPFAVLLLGCLMGPRLAVSAVFIYLSQALMGLPVLQGPVAGPLAFVGPTAGFLFGFIPAAYFAGVLYHRGIGRTFFSGFALFMLCSFCFDIPGLAWLTYLTNVETAKAAFLSYTFSTVLKAGLGGAILAAIAHHKHHHKSTPHS